MAKKAATKVAKKTVKKPAKKSAKRPARKSTKKKAVARASVGASPEAAAAASHDGSPVALFFDEVDKTLDLQARIAAHNTRILDIAREAGFDFTYEEMANHLKARWCIVCGPKEHYCCF